MKSLRLLYLGCLTLNHFQRMVRWFASQGNEVHVLTFESYVPAQGVEGVQVHTFPAGPRRLRLPQSTKWKHSNVVRRLVKEIRADVVHAHFLTEFGFYAAVSGADARLISLTGSDAYFNWSASPALWCLNVAALHRADQVFVPSGDVARFIRDHLLTPPFKTTVVPDGVLDAIVDARPPQSWNKDPTLVVSTRRLSPTYNVGTFIEAAALSASESKDVMFTVAADGVERPALEERTRGLGLERRCSFVGWLPSDALVDLLSRATIYVSTSKSDGSSVSLLEAMALGAFPIVSDIPANRAWIRHGENGLLFPVGEPRALAREIVNALGHPDMVAAAVTANRERIERVGRFSRSMALIEDHYRTRRG